MWVCPWLLNYIGLCTGCCPDHPICSLPADSGPCNSEYSLRWYFNPLDGLCRQFLFGGCEGNGNNFDTKSECVLACNAGTSDVELCSIPKDEGPCTARYERWFYDGESGRCRRFIFGGCDGNDNRFDSEQDCLTTCSRRSLKQHDNVISAKSNNRCQNSLSLTQPLFTCTDFARESPQRCLQPLLRGPCNGTLPRWYFNTGTGDCLPFPYGGCHGNRNRFLTKEFCVTACHGKLSEMERLKGGSSSGAPSAVESSNHHRLKSSENTLNSDPREDDEEKESNDQMDSAKQDVDANPDASGVCRLMKDPGPCSDYVPVWYFDPISGSCRRFRYGGCQGNDNRFSTQQECRKRCLEPVWSEMEKGSFIQAGMLPLNDRRVQSLSSGTGAGVVLPDAVQSRVGSWKRKDTLVKDRNQGLRPQGQSSAVSRVLVRPGDRGQHRRAEFERSKFNENRNDRSFLENSVERLIQPRSAQEFGDPRCSLPEVGGEVCPEWHIYWFFDNHISRCSRFFYQGCDRVNANRFKTENDCIRACQRGRKI